MKKLFISFLLILFNHSYSSVDLRSIREYVHDSLTFDDNDDKLSGLILLKNIKNDPGFGYLGMFNKADDFFNPSELGHATDGFFYTLFLYWLTNFFLKDQKFQQGFLDLCVKRLTGLWIKRNAPSSPATTGGFYYRPYTIKSDNIIEITKVPQLNLLKESIQKNNVRFYSTIFFNSNFDSEGAHYYMIGIDNNIKIIYIINPLGGYNSNAEENVGKKSKDELGSNFKNYSVKGINSGMQEQNESCGIVAVFMAFYFALGGFELLEKIFSLYSIGSNNSQHIYSFEDITISKLQQIQTNYTLKLIQHDHQFRKNMELSFAKFIYNFLQTIPSFEFSSLFPEQQKFITKKKPINKSNNDQKKSQPLDKSIIKSKIIDKQEIISQSQPNLILEKSVQVHEPIIPKIKSTIFETISKQYNKFKTWLINLKFR